MTHVKLRHRFRFYPLPQAPCDVCRVGSSVHVPARALKVVGAVFGDHSVNRWNCFDGLQFAERFHSSQPDRHSLISQSPGQQGD